MGTNRRARFRPRHDILEDRCLLSQAVIDIQNNSSQAVVNHQPGAELSFASHSSPASSPSPSSSPTPTPSPTPAPNPVLSGNWSGYVAAPNLSSPQPGSVTDVSANWTVPTVTGSHKQTAYSAVWVGIDGYFGSSQTVEQVGTAQDIVHGRASYYAWWEMWSSGANMPEQQITSMTIQ
ncbi:MAG: G1 family glutamic endopeptidase, partial [Isosphaeraceae bacterium]